MSKKSTKIWELNKIFLNILWSLKIDKETQKNFLKRKNYIKTHQNVQTYISMEQNSVRK